MGGVMLGLRIEFWIGLLVSWVVGTVLVHRVAEKQGRDAASLVLWSIIGSPAVVYAYLLAIGPRSRCLVCARHLDDSGNCQGYHPNLEAMFTQAQGLLTATTDERLRRRDEDEDE